MAERRNPSPYLRKIWRDAAWERLWAAFDAGWAACPRDLRVETQAVRGETGPVLVDVADQPDDLLIIGTGRRAGFGRMMRKSVSRYCLAHARCPVLAVPPSALMDEMSRPLHSWHGRRHELIPEPRTCSPRPRLRPRLGPRASARAARAAVTEVSAGSPEASSGSCRSR